MNEQFDLEQGWKNEPLKYLYPTQAHLTNSTKCMEMLQNVLLMIRDANGVPLAAVICKRLIPRPDSDDITFGLLHSEYVFYDEDMIDRAPILDRKIYDQTATDKALEKKGPFDPRYLAARSLIWTVIKGCIGTNNKLNIQLKKFNNTTDRRIAYFAIERFLLGNDHSPSLISAAEKGLRETTYTSNVNNWKIEDYITKHMEFHSTLDYQRALGTYKGMFEKQKVDRLLDGLNSNHFIGLKSNTLCNQTLRSDFNATASRLNDMVNRTPQIHSPPGSQASAMGRGGGVAVALAAVDTMAAPDVTDVVGADMTVAADTGGVAMTLLDVVIAYQAQPPSGPTDALTKKPLNAQNRAL